MSRCDNEGATHHTGCECHEARRDAEIERLKAEVERLMITNNDCNRALDWAKGEMNKLREVVRRVHELVSKVRLRSTALMEDIEYLREIHKITKENP